MNIALLAIGKAGYHMAAFNLAVSIKHFDPTAKILLITDAGISRIPNQTPFDRIEQIEGRHTIDRGTWSPSLAKMNVDGYAVKHFKRSPYLFLDVDNVALKSLAPLWSACEGSQFLTGVEGKGGKGDAIAYSVWATNETIWSKFGLSDKATYYAAHSDWWYSDGSKEVSAIFTDAAKLLAQVDMADLRLKWGKAIPDELPFGAAISRSGIDPTPTFISPTFLGNRPMQLADMKRDYYLLSIYGNGSGRSLTRPTFLEFYDRHMRDILRPKGIGHNFKTNFIMRDKWINK